MSTASARATSRSWSRAAAALSAIAGLVIGLAVAAAAPASAATIPTPDPQCAVTPYTPPSSTPVLTSLAVAPTAVDVRTGARSVVITAAAHDTEPLSRIWVYVDGPKGSRAAFYVHLALVGGTALDGTWRGTLVVPQGIEPGAYHVEKVMLVDVEDGAATYGPSLPGWGAWSTSFTVKSVSDVTAPRLRRFTTSTPAVNTSVTAKKIRVRVVVTDGQSGVRSVYVQVVRDRSKARFYGASLEREKKGSNVWVGAVEVPAWQGKGTRTWKLHVSATNGMGRYKSWTRSDLAARGFRSTVRVTSRTDTTQPTIAGVSLSATSIDARSGDKTLSFSFRVTDPQSGPGSFDVRFLREPVTITSITGGAHDKTYSGYVVVPRCNYVRLTAADNLTIDTVDVWGAERKWPLAHQARATRTVAVQQIDAAAPFAEAPATVAAGRPLTLSFTEPVLLDRPMGSALAVKVGAATAAGTWVCRDGASAVVVCDADGADVVTATFTPTTPFASGAQLHVTRVTAAPAPVGIYDLVGNPAIADPLAVVVT